MKHAVDISGGPSRRQQLMAQLESELLVDAAAVGRARRVAERTGQPVEQVLNQLGILSDDALAHLYASFAQCEIWEPGARPISIDPEHIGVAIEFLRRARLAPLDEERGWLVVAACDPAAPQV